MLLGENSAFLVFFEQILLNVQKPALQVLGKANSGKSCIQCPELCTKLVSNTTGIFIFVEFKLLLNHTLVVS